MKTYMPEEDMVGFQIIMIDTYLEKVPDRYSDRNGSCCMSQTTWEFNAFARLPLEP